jgi:hypothetical protein
MEKNMSYVFAVKFNRMDKELLIDGLLESIEVAKKECIKSNLDWEEVTFEEVENSRVFPKYLSFKKDMFSNKVNFSLIELT